MSQYERDISVIGALFMSFWVEKPGKRYKNTFLEP